MLMVRIKDRDKIALSQKEYPYSLLLLKQYLPWQRFCKKREFDSEEFIGDVRDIFTKKHTLNPAHAWNVDNQSDVSYPVWNYFITL